MPTEKPRLTFTASEDLKDQINEYQFTQRIKNQSQAIISLINKGMDVINQEHEKSMPASDILYISKPTGNGSTDELRKYLHDMIDQMDDEDLQFFRDITIRMRKE